jgi:hypothetical protein
MENVSEIRHLEDQNEGERALINLKFQKVIFVEDLVYGL